MRRCRCSILLPKYIAALSRMPAIMISFSVIRFHSVLFMGVGEAIKDEVIHLWTQGQSDSQGLPSIFGEKMPMNLTSVSGWTTSTTLFACTVTCLITFGHGPHPCIGAGEHFPMCSLHAVCAYLPQGGDSSGDTYSSRRAVDELWVLPAQRLQGREKKWVSDHGTRYSGG